MLTRHHLRRRALPRRRSACCRRCCRSSSTCRSTSAARACSSSSAWRSTPCSRSSRTSSRATTKASRGPKGPRIRGRTAAAPGLAAAAARWRQRSPAGDPARSRSPHRPRRPSGRRQGHAGQAARGALRHPAARHRRHAARARAAGQRARQAGRGDHGRRPARLRRHRHRSDRRAAAPRRPRAGRHLRRLPAHASPQAEALDACSASTGREIDRCVLIEVADEEVVRRNAGRRTCLTCGRTYHVEFAPPKVAGRLRRATAGGWSSAPTTSPRRSRASRGATTATPRRSSTTTRQGLLRGSTARRLERCSPLARAIDGALERHSVTSIGSARTRPTMSVYSEDAAGDREAARRPTSSCGRPRRCCGGGQAGRLDLGAQRDRRARDRAPQGRSRRSSAIAPAVPGGPLHLLERGRRPRHPAQGSGPQGRRHHRHRLRLLQGRLLRRLGAHGRDRQGLRRGAEAHRGDPRIALERGIAAVLPGNRLATSARPFRSTSRRTAFRSSATSSATASAGRCTKIPGPQLRRAGQGHR